MLARYIEDIRKVKTGEVPLAFMESNGMLSHPLMFTGKSALLTGPAGGLMAVAKIAEETKVKGVIGFDMGGTSTDISRIESGYKGYLKKILQGSHCRTK